jgi:hypothetical protein
LRPEILVPRVTRGWSRAPGVALRRAQDGAQPLQATRVRIAHDLQALSLRFDCDDRDIWATHTGRDAPLWEEEVVEVFLAPGDDDPAEYFEIEVNPLGAIFDARVHNPHGRRDTMTVDATWDAVGLVVTVDRPTPRSWCVELRVPWSDLCRGTPPPVWRANFFRIERPRDGDQEFSCWSPTLSEPPDFHKPVFFGRLILDAPEVQT